MLSSVPQTYKLHYTAGLAAGEKARRQGREYNVWNVVFAARVYRQCLETARPLDENAVLAYGAGFIEAFCPQD